MALGSKPRPSREVLSMLLGDGPVMVMWKPRRYRVRQSVRKGRYRSAKSTGDRCIRSPQKLKIVCGPHKSVKSTEQRKGGNPIAAKMKKKYESNDQEQTGTQSGSEYTDPAKLAIRSVHSKPPKAVALKEKPTHLTAKRGTNNYRSLCY